MLNKNKLGKDHPRYDKLSRYEYRRLTSSDEPIMPWPPVYRYDSDEDNKNLPHCEYIVIQYQRQIFPELE